MPESVTEKTKRELREQLEQLDAKADWEGGLAEMLLSYGGLDLFPGKSKAVASKLQDTFEELKLELASLSHYCDGPRNLW